MTPQSPQPEDRLSQASELFQLVRTDPAASKRKPAELAAQFGLPVEVVERLLINARPIQEKRFSPGFERIKKIGPVIGGFFTGHPLAIVLVSGLITATMVFGPTLRGLAPSLSSTIKTAVFLAMTVLQFSVFVLCRKSRYAVIAGGTTALSFAILALSAPNADAGSLKHSDLTLLILIGGVVMGLLYTGLGELFILAGGAVHQARERKREQEQTRHQLLQRYFDLQARLGISKPLSKPEGQFVSFLRAYPFPIAFLFSLALSLAVCWLTVANHVDANTHNYVNLSVNGSGTKVSNPDQMPSSAFIIGAVGLMVVQIAGMITLPAVARNFRSVYWITLGNVLGALVGNLIVPVNGYKGIPGVVQYIVLGLISLTWQFAFASFAFVGFRFQREWAKQKLLDANDSGALLSELLDVQWRLAATPTDVAVLVVDVAGSTRLKAGADALAAEYSFGSYQSWVARIVAANSGKVEATTGDGAIAAFGNPNQAVLAARQILKELPDFNVQHNRLSGPFRLRVALHLGEVYADLKSVQFSHVIDVAAHVEKVAPVNGIALTAPLLAKIDASEFLEEGPEVDGISVHLLRDPTYSTVGS